MAPWQDPRDDKHANAQREIRELLENDSLNGTNKYSHLRSYVDNSWCEMGD